MVRKRKNRKQLLLSPQNEQMAERLMYKYQLAKSCNTTWMEFGNELLRIGIVEMNKRIMKSLSAVDHSDQVGEIIASKIRKETGDGEV